MFEEFRERLQAVNISTHTPKPSRRFSSFYDDDDDNDYKESTNPLNEIISQIPPSNVIIPILPTFEDLEDSLIMGNEELSTILEKKSDEFIKSSVEDLVLILSGDVDEIKLLLHHDPSTLKMSVAFILEGFTNE
nr:hypothetical protein [Tanacetum cinerariifolium]